MKFLQLDKRSSEDCEVAYLTRALYNALAASRYGSINVYIQRRCAIQSTSLMGKGSAGNKLGDIHHKR